MKTYPIISITLIVIVLTVASHAADGPKFLCPPDYQSCCIDLAEYSGSEIIDLSGEWFYDWGKSDSRQKVTLPASWLDYCGKVKFSRQVRLDSAHVGKRIRLVITGLSNRCAIHLNDNFIGDFAGGELDIILPQETYFFGGKNILEIEVDNRLDPLNTIPLGNGALCPFTYGGITGDIFFLLQETPFIHDLSVSSRLSNDQEGIVELKYSVVQAPLESLAGEVKAQVLDNTGMVVAFNSTIIDESDPIELDLTVNRPKLWSLKNPNMYSVEVWLETEKGKSNIQRRRIGFRKISLTDNMLQLNGEDIKIKGITYWAENEYGFTLSSKDFAKDLELIRSCGANTIYLPRPASPCLLALCDSLGMLVIQSTSLDGVPSSILKRKSLLTAIEGHVKKLTSSRTFHPSIAAWVIGRGLSEDFPRDIISQWFPADERILMMESGGGHLRKLISLERENAFTIPTLFAVSAPQSESQEQSQKLLYERYIQIMSQSNSKSGIILGSFADFYAGREILFQGNILCGKLFKGGLVERSRGVKLVYNQLQSGWFNKESTSLVAADISQPLVFPLAVAVIVLLGLLSIRNNKPFRTQLKRAFAHSYGFFVDIRNNRYINPLQTVIVSLISSLVVSLLLAEFIYFHKSGLSFDFLIGHLFSYSGVSGLLTGLIWNPLSLTICLFLIISLLYFISALLFKLATIILHGKTSIKQSLHFVYWSGANLLWLIPLPLIFYRCLSTPGLKNLALIIILIFALWYYLRMVKAVRVVCGGYTFKSFIVLTFINIAFLSVIVIYLHLKYALLYYWNYIFSVV